MVCYITDVVIIHTSVFVPRDFSMIKPQQMFESKIVFGYFQSITITI